MLKNLWNNFFFLFTLQIPLVTITGIDYIVHSWLYHWGLQYSSSWAIPYWILLDSTFLGIGLVALTAYRMNGEESLKKSLLVFSTIIGEIFGGFLDSLWFLIHALAGYKTDWTQNWWWSPWSKIFSSWTLESNLILNCIVGFILCLLWWKWRNA